MPIDPATAISAGASVVGGLLGRNKAVKPGDVIRQTRAGILGQASGARQASELYGFNPLTLLGVSQPLVPQAVDNSMMGQAIANAGLAVADGLTAASAQKAYVGKLEEQNQELRKALDGQTLRPKIPGIYGTATPTAGVAGSVEVAELSSLFRGQLGGSAAGNVGYPGRDTRVEPVKDLPMLAEIELPGGERFAVPHDGDEIMGAEKLPTLGAAFAFQRGKQRIQDWKDFGKSLNANLAKDFDPGPYVKAYRHPLEVGPKQEARGGY